MLISIVLFISVSELRKETRFVCENRMPPRGHLRVTGWSKLKICTPNLYSVPCTDKKKSQAELGFVDIHTDRQD